MGQTEITIFVILASIILLIFITGIVVFIVKYRRKQMEHHIELLQNEYETRERTIRQVSRDLHDEIGSSLSGINLFAQMAHQQLQGGQPAVAEDFLKKISSYSETVIEKTGDMIWMMQPENDTQDKVLQRLRTFAESLTNVKHIRLKFEVDPGFSLPAPEFLLRKNIYLICKEAINNAVKYSGCTELSLSFGLHKIIIADNGNGFHAGSITTGHGLQNMQQRAAETNIKVDIDTAHGKGTSITILR